MMIEPVNSILTLAADEGFDSTVQLVLFVVIAIGSVIGAVVKKAGEKRQQEQARRQAQEAKEILARRAQREQARQTPPPPPKLQPRPSMFAAPPKPVSAEEAHLTERTPIKHLPAGEELVHTIMPSEWKHDHPRTKKSVADFIQKPTPAIAVPTAPVAASEMRMMAERMESNVHTRVNLMDPAAAQAAIIFQEILSPPKALRDRPELWE
jgi:hypothetical protein